MSSDKRIKTIKKFIEKTPFFDWFFHNTNLFGQAEALFHLRLYFFLSM